MSLKKDSKSNKLFIFLGILFLIVLILGTIYYKYFYPHTEVKALDSSISIDKNYIIKKFVPDKFNLSLREASIESSASFNDEEITDFFIMAFNENSSSKENITGLKTKIENDSLNLYLHLKYKGIPLESKLTFTGENINGKAVFHYKEGKLGFINISKEDLFSKFKDTSIVKFDKGNGDITLSLENLKHIEITNLSIKDDKINLTFKGSLKF